MVCTIECNDDNRSEFIVKNDNRVYLTNQKNTSFLQINCPDSNYLFLAYYDIDNKPPKELLFRHTKENSTWIAVYSDNQLWLDFEIIANEESSRVKNHGTDICGVVLSDINSDGFKDMIFQICTAFDKQPRGILAYDWKNRTELWHCWIGAYHRYLYLHDINNDGEDEVIIGTTAVSNGSVLNGFSDYESYVITVDKKGRILWYRKIGDAFSDALCWAGDLDRDGIVEEVVVEGEGSGKKEESNIIYILEGRSGETRKLVSSGEKYFGMKVCDIDRDEKYEIITGNTDGVVRVYDINLCLKLVRNFGKPVYLVDALDTNGDGATEIFVQTGDSKLLILDEYLQKTGACSIESSKPVSISPVCNGYKNKLLIAEGNKPPYKYSLISVIEPDFLTVVYRSKSLMWKD